MLPVAAHSVFECGVRLRDGFFFRGGLVSSRSEKRVPALPVVHAQCLEPEKSVTVSMGVDFNDSTQAASFQLCTKAEGFNVSIQPAVGELLLPVTMSEQDFSKEQGKLQGMNESSATIAMTPESITSQPLHRKVVNMANVGVVPSGQNNVHRFAAKLVSSGALVLVCVVQKDSGAQLTVNTEKTIIGSMLLRELQTVLSAP
ncbi:AP-3 complex subunit beta-1 isoform X2 [Electrophorus electricus]|uniref:AP-3 complex subunit beta-1 isoform X2 n=1 Tax=Electrophorus electricus TaxID=8005 RepID=UPI0015D05CB5|nr:AP-3 complex subunit beta-1 isoform X2 [Electrophorus electricus]